MCKSCAVRDADDATTANRRTLADRKGRARRAVCALGCPREWFGLGGQGGSAARRPTAVPGRARDGEKLPAPLATRGVGEDDSAFPEYLFDVAKAEAEPKVQPHRVADDLDRKAVILICCGEGWCVHAVTLTHCVGTKQVDNAV
jgi:hypothetical protein